MAERSLKGHIRLDIDAAGLTAELVFSPDPSGGDLNEGSVFKLLADRKVVYGIKKDAVSRFFKETADAGGALRLQVAEGDPPGLPSPETYEWDDLPVPDEMAEDAKRVQLTAPEPEIVKTTVQKVRIKKRVVIKSRLPFGKPREEIREEIETREKTDPVPVDPTVVSAGWAAAGSRIAVFKPGKPGTLGKSVFGTAIPPDVSEDEFYLSRGIEKKKGELIARYSGFLRRGSNWVDIISFQHHEWNLSFSNDKITCLLDFKPGGSDAGVPDPEVILGEARGLGVDLSTCISAEELHEKLKDAVREGKPLEKLSLNEDRDGYFSIEIPDDKMTASLVMVKGRGRGKPLVLKDVGRAIKTSGIKGLDLQKIQTDILAFYRSNDAELCDYVLATGTPPVEPGSAEIKGEVAFLENARVAALRERLENFISSGQVQMESLEAFPVSSISEMAPVDENQLIAAVPPQKGGDGKDVFGNVVLPTGIENPGYTIFEHLKVEGTSIVSTIKGILDWGETDKGLLLRCRPHADAVIDIKVSPDFLSAYLSLTPAVGTGNPLSLEAINAAVQEQKITEGIEEGAINGAFTAASNGETVQDMLIARGNPPTNQGESRLSFELDLSTGKGVSIRKDGRADFKNQDRITGIQEGVRIAVIRPPEIESLDGWDIFGKTLKAQSSPPVNIQIGENIRQETDADGTTVLYAAHKGEILYDGKSLSIRDVHSVKGDVGPRTGNIKFSGAVEISGNVNPGFAVFSGSDVLIGENVEAALISADGSISINQGVKGSGKAVLRSKKDITAAFIEQAIVLAVGDVNVKNSCLRSSIKTNGMLNLASDKGDLIGGTIRVRRGLSASSVGNEKGMKTLVSFGQDYLVADKIELEEKEITKLKNAIAKIDSSLRQYEKVGDRARLDTVRREKLMYLKMIEKRSIRLFNYREKFEEHNPSTITIRDTLYPGVVFESHGRFKEITAPQKNVKISFDAQQGQIVLIAAKEEKE